MLSFLKYLESSGLEHMETINLETLKHFHGKKRLFVLVKYLSHGASVLGGRHQTICAQFCPFRENVKKSFQVVMNASVYLELSN